MAYAERTEDLSLVARGKTLAATLAVRGDDFRVTTSIDGESYASGRANGVRWRRTSTGVVHVIGADVQGDDLDRWPLALVPTVARDVEVAGSVRTPVDANVVVERSATDSPHWFYVDRATGDIVREVVREGSRTVDVRFSDFRDDGGVRRAFAWHVSGAGGDADVRVESIHQGHVDAANVAIPASATMVFGAADPGAGRNLSTSFRRAQIVLDARVDGRPVRLLLDTGTPQIVLDAGFVRSLHHEATLGHAVVDEIDVGGLSAHHVSITAMQFGGSQFDGILGYDFFVGGVVRVDYKHQRVDWVPRDSFVPEATMTELVAPAREGMPIVDVGLGGTIARRFVLDTGSYRIVLMRQLLESAPRPEDLGIDPHAGPAVEQPYLEGSIFTREQTLRSFLLANVDFRNVPAQIEIPDRLAAVTFPIDGIIGSSLLLDYEWWFDETGGRVWFR